MNYEGTIFLPVMGLFRYIHQQPIKNMRPFDLFSKKPAKAAPYKNEGINTVYDLLFCDKVQLYKKTNNEPDVYPWTILLAEKPDPAELVKVSLDTTLESRARALACNLLIAARAKPDRKEIFGVITEVALPGGLDVLAAYSDRTARYINHSEKLLVWETRSEKSDEIIARLFQASVQVVNQIGPWHKERRPFPTGGAVRLSFLVSDGLYFGEARFEVLQVDPMGGPVINVAAELMDFLTAQKQ